MSYRVEIVNGEEGGRLASRLLDAVWPPELVATLPWKDVVFAHADSCVLSINDQDDVIGHAGLFLRNATFNALPVHIGGIGGVSTRFDCRRQGIAGDMMREAVRAMRDTHGVDFGLLFCEPRHAPLYEQLGWRLFEGEVFVEQPRQGRVRFSVAEPLVFDLKIAPRSGILDLCGLPW